MAYTTQNGLPSGMMSGGLQFDPSMWARIQQTPGAVPPPNSNPGWVGSPRPVQSTGPVAGDQPPVSMDPSTGFTTPGSMMPGAAPPVTGGGGDPFAGFRVPNLPVSALTTGVPSLPQVDLSKYMNPYQSSVIDSALTELDRQHSIDLAGNADKAMAAHAFGGDRQAVADSMLNDTYARNRSSTMANLLSSGFTNAQGVAQADLNRAQQAQTTNAGNFLTAQGQDINQNNAFLNAALAQRQQDINNGNTQATLGLTAADTASNILYRSGLADWTSINQGAGAVGNQGNSSTNTTTTGPGSNPWLTLVGSLLTGYGMSQR